MNRTPATRRRRDVAIALAGLLAAGLTGPARAEPPPAERARIEALLTHLSQDTRHRFERGNRRYTGAEAARFLRAKWQARGSHVRTAEEFIEQIASRSSTTGQPYRVCDDAGRCVPAQAHLSRILADT